MSVHAHEIKAEGILDELYELDQANANPKDLNEAIVDAINCMNGR